MAGINKKQQVNGQQCTHENGMLQINCNRVERKLVMTSVSTSWWSVAHAEIVISDLRRKGWVSRCSCHHVTCFSVARDGVTSALALPINLWLLGTWRTLSPLGWLFCCCLLVFDFLLVAALVRGDHHSPMSFAWSARGFPFGSLHQHHEDGCVLRKAHCWACLAALSAATLEPSLAENWSWWAFPWKFTLSWRYVLLQIHLLNLYLNLNV